MGIGSLPRSNGRECWIFAAAGPHELLGGHGDLIHQALPPDEPLLALVYFPIWDATATPFGDAAAPGSHVLAVTARRFLLSHNSHRRASAPTVVNIPFESVLAVEWGSSLLSGWATVRHAGPAATTWMYRATGGRHHLAAALRAYRRSFPVQPPATCADVPWDTVHATALPALSAEMAPLLLDGESARGLLHSRELWQPGRGLRRRPTCRSHQGLLVATDRGLLLTERAPAVQRSVLDVAARCIATPWASLETLAEHDTPAAPSPASQRGLLVRWRREAATWQRWLAAAPGAAGGPQALLAALPATAAPDQPAAATPPSKPNAKAAGRSDAFSRLIDPG